MQIIYAGKTTACHPHGVTFPSRFCVSQNPNNWSNEEEILKLIDKIIYPYLVKKYAEINLAKNQKAFVIWDVFWGGWEKRWRQACCYWCANSCACKYDPYFQPIELTINGSAKTFLQSCFTEYDAEAVK